MDNEWVPYLEGLRLSGKPQDKDGRRWAAKYGVPWKQIPAQKNGRYFVSKEACLALRNTSQTVHADFEDHPESYDINIKITVTREMLKAIFMKE